MAIHAGSSFSGVWLLLAKRMNAKDVPVAYAERIIGIQICVCSMCWVARRDVLGCAQTLYTHRYILQRDFIFSCCWCIFLLWGLNLKHAARHICANRLSEQNAWISLLRSSVERRHSFILFNILAILAYVYIYRQNTLQSTTSHRCARTFRLARC